MGCGKSTLGKRLAEHLGLRFIDMDDYIEERNCKSVPQIFAEEGENGFREKERKVLRELSEFIDLVIATGGGAPCFFDNMDLMNQSGKTIYLNIPPEILTERLLNSKTERPLIKGKSREELLAFINEKLEIRNKFYSRAKYQITNPEAELVSIEKMLQEDSGKALQTI